MTTNKQDTNLPNCQLKKREGTPELSITNRTGNFIIHYKKEREFE